MAAALPAQAQKIGQAPVGEPAVPQSHSVEQADARLAEVERSRAAVQAEYAAAEQVCNAKFFVNYCLDAVKEKRRVALCKLLLSKPDMLLLDEPTNHLDAESVDWLEQFLVRFPGTVVGITHDRYFLDNAAEWILELDRGSGIPWKGNYSSWLDQKQARLKQEEATESARQKALQKELEWSRQNPKARQAKSKARIQKDVHVGVGRF
eukprot:gene36959-41839_t